MSKRFDEWNEEKKVLNAGGATQFCHAREIWWCSLGVNIGFEQDGTGKNFDRPIVVMKAFSRNVFLGIALTGRRKEGKYYFPIGLIDGREASAILSQVRLIDTKRLVKKIGSLDAVLFEELKNVLKRTLFD